MKKPMTTHLLAMAMIGLVTAGVAHADIRVKCEKRANVSTVSVDGRNLGAGTYTAEIDSGSNHANSKASRQPVAGEVEFDFSSKARDVAAGATAISGNFIQGGKVTASLKKDGFVVNSYTASCRVR